MKRDTELVPLVERALKHGARVAVVDARGTFTYQDLLEVSARVAEALLSDRADLQEGRVAFLLTPGFPWVAVQWGIWRAGGVAVPLPLNTPRAELEYFVGDSGAATLVFDAAGAEVLSPIAASRGLRALAYEQSLASGRAAPGCTTRDSVPEQAEDAAMLPAIGVERRAMILYTSGTTNRPKGVVTTHTNTSAQITTLIEAWEWSPQDRILLCLPLHHVHGIINVLSCTLWAGATCQMLPRFDAEAVWEQLASGDLTLFMAVPTVYAKLIAAWENASPERRATLSWGVSRLRLMVSGSAALPVGTLERWREISGQTLLERYGARLDQHLGRGLGNRHGAGKSAAWRTHSGKRWGAAAARGCATRWRQWRATGARNGRRNRGTWAERFRRVLGSAGGDARGVSRRLVSHRGYRDR